MSRTKHSNRWWRNTKSGGLYKRYLHMWSDDFIHKTKCRELSRSLRTKLKRQTEREIKEMLRGRCV